MSDIENCIFWQQPDLLLTVPLKEQFELLETFVDDSHWWRYVLKCRECGQLYFYEFYEVIDWEGGNDPQSTTLVPFNSAEELEALRATNHLTLLDQFPRLQRNWPKDAKHPNVGWVGRTT